MDGVYSMIHVEKLTKCRVVISRQIDLRTTNESGMRRADEQLQRQVYKVYALGNLAVHYFLPRVLIYSIEFLILTGDFLFYPSFLPGNGAGRWLHTC